MTTSVPIAHFDWAQIGRSFEQMECLSPKEADQIRDALNYLRLKLGEGILSRVEAKWGLRHPLFEFLGAPFNFPPATRLAVVNWSKSLRALERCRNVGRVLSDLERRNKCEHAYRLIEVAGALTREGMKILFEPPSVGPECGKRPDALVEYPPTKERFYLELSCQGLANRQLEPFGAMGACYEPLRKIDPTLRFSGKLIKMPAEAHFEQMRREIEAAGQRASAERSFVEISHEGVLQMAICPPDKLSELERWSEQRGLSPNGFEGPLDDTNASVRLGDKIKAEQEQLPPGYANVLVVESRSLPCITSDVRGLISELEERVYQYRHVAIVIVRGHEHTDVKELPWKLEKGEERFEHQVTPRHVEEILLLSNRFADVRPSEQLRAKLVSAFFGSDSDGSAPTTE
jgi:hypothetical protein